jgi:FlaA1/EpsC-like NDP-sugar epimerase
MNVRLFWNAPWGTYFSRIPKILYQGKYMRILITGGAGFIGSHLAEKLLEAGEEVYIIDDLSTGSTDNINLLKQKDLITQDYFFTNKVS